MISLAEILTPSTESEYLDRLLAVLREAKFPVDSWHSTSVPRTLAQAFARAMAGLDSLAANVAKLGFTSLAKGVALSYRAESDYGSRGTRKAAAPAVRIVAFTNTTGSPIVLTGTTWIQTASGKRFSQSTGATLAASDVTYLIMTAAEAGVAYNVGTTTWSLVSSIAGVTVADPGGYDRTIRYGADAERDEDLAARCALLWSELGEGTAEWYESKALGAHASISRAKVRAHYPLPGQVTVYIAGDTSPVSEVSGFGYLTQTGTGPALTPTGTPVYDRSYVLEVLTGGARGTATFRVSYDGGATWPIASATTAASYAVTDDGLTIGMASGTYVQGERYAWTGAASVVTTCQRILDAACPTCDDPIVANVTAVAQSVTGVVTVQAGKAAAALSQLEASLLDLTRTLGIGGKVIRNEIIQRIMSCDGVSNVTLTTPAADSNLGATEIATFSASALSWYEVE